MKGTIPSIQTRLSRTNDFGSGNIASSSLIAQLPFLRRVVRVVFVTSAQANPLRRQHWGNAP
jgi:hypothetical protein